MQDERQSSKVIWTETTHTSGWPVGIQFLIGLASPVIAFCPIDGAVHLVETVNHARRVVPRTILAGVCISFLTSLAFLLATLYSIADFEAVVSTPAFPLFSIWQQVTDSDAVPVIFTLITILLLPIGSTGCFQVASMMTWSLGRDGGLPFSTFLATVNESLDVPGWSLLADFVIIFVIGLLQLFTKAGKHVCWLHIVILWN